MASVTRRTKRTREDRREGIRLRLLEAVEALLEQGESFAEISVERVASAAGVSRSTFYVYFQDKGELLSAWFQEITDELKDVAAQWWALDGDTTRADLHAALDRIVRSYQPHMTLMAAVYDTASYDPSVRELVAEMMGVNVAGLRKHIRKGQRDGFVDPSLQAEETAAWLMWMAERGFHRLVSGAEPAAVDRLIDAYVSIVWNTLYAPVRH
jgi:TetR/AcrR family transcriptional regulator, ethionamide resistance regulator